MIVYALWSTILVGVLRASALLDTTGAVALEQGGLVCGEHSVHLLTADDCVLELELHLVDVPFKLLQEGEHVRGLAKEVHDLRVLIVDGFLRNIPDEGKVLLYPVEHVFGVEARKQTQLSLQVHLCRPSENVEFLRLNKVGTAGSLPHEHIQQEAALFNEFDLAGTESLLWRQGRHIHSCESVYQ